MYRNITGTKYEQTKGMGITDIAKLVRKDLKEAFPTYKFKVQTQKYSMGCSLHIQIQDTGFDQRKPEHDEPIKLLRQAVRQVTDAYNFDNSDPMTDYFSVRFYANDIRVES